MSDKKKSQKSQDENTEKKKPYIKPEIETEDLMTFGALCNGTTMGGRKSATGAPQWCNASRINS